MAHNRTIQLYRGTTAQNDAFTGAIGELTMDTTTNELRLHDGTTAGGHKIGGNGYHPGLFAHEWDDHLRNDVQWLRADTFSWQDGSVYQAAYRELLQDMYIKALWGSGGNTAYTRYRLPAVGQMAYSDISLTTERGQITATDGETYIVVNNTTYSYNAGVVDSYNETIAGTTISYARSTTGRKVVFSQDESKVAAIYNATGVAWYYIIDAANQQFKLPRINPDKAMLIANSIPVITGSRHANTGGALTWKDGNNNDYGGGGGAYLRVNNSVSEFANMGNVQPTLANNVKPDNLYADSSSATSYYAGKKYLYFYVGSFTQTAIENTAGLNTEMFNDLNAHKIIAVQEATAANGYTWYRKYADGWVEQGCLNCNLPAQSANTSASARFSFPITMASTVYHSDWIKTGDGGNTMALVQLSVTRATTYVDVSFYSTVSTAGASIIDISISGKAA